MIEETLRDLGYPVPEPFTPPAHSIPLTVHDGVAYVCAQIARSGDGTVHPIGKVGAEVDFEQAKEAARNCVLQGLAWLRHHLGGLDRIERVLRIRGVVALTPGFDRMSEVIDAASDLLIAAFGEDGRHPRSVIGVPELPRNAPVLIELTIAVRPDESRSS